MQKEEGERENGGNGERGREERQRQRTFLDQACIVNGYGIDSELPGSSYIKLITAT